MSVKVTGFDDVMREMEKRLGASSVQRLSNEGVEEAAHYFADALRKELASIPGTYRTGATVEELEVYGPVSESGASVYVIRWRGDDDRYRLIHINEWGTVKNPDPPMKGAIARVLKNTEKKYYEIIQDKIRRGVIQ